MIATDLSYNYEDMHDDSEKSEDEATAAARQDANNGDVHCEDDNSGIDEYDRDEDGSDSKEEDEQKLKRRRLRDRVRYGGSRKMWKTAVEDWNHIMENGNLPEHQRRLKK